MLEKNLNFSYFDAHFHYSDCILNNCYDTTDKITGCSVAFSKNDFLLQKEQSKLLQAFGIHPFYVTQQNVQNNILYLETLLKEDQIDAIGEAGFDLFTSELKETQVYQEQYFNHQIDLAIKYQKPLIIHCRKANEKLFEYSNKLNKLPSVLFHSFMGTSKDAESLINRGINGYFSFGKQILNNNKKVLDCVINLPIQQLLFETDAPFQFLKNENHTSVSEIQLIYEKSYKLRIENNKTLSNNKKSYEDFQNQINQNFHSLYRL